MRSKTEINNDIQNSMLIESQLKIANELLLDLREILLSRHQVTLDGGTPSQTATSEVPTEDKQIPDISVFDLDIPMRIQSALNAAKIHTLKDLAALNVLDLSRFRGIGKTSIIALKKALVPYGVQIAGERSLTGYKQWSDI